MPKTTELTINDGGKRIDAALASAGLEHSRSTLASWIKDGQVLVNGQPVKSSYKVKSGDKIRITVPDTKSVAIQPENIPLDIVYEDDDLLVVNKEQGMVVHPAAGHAGGTLVNALLFHAPLSSINGEFRPGIVHRIDRDTSGLLMVAKNDRAHQALAAELKAHKTERYYYALVKGEFKEDHGTVDAPIGRHPKDRKKQAVVAGGREAVTHFEVLERFHGYTLLRLALETGRTHQIRVHMQYIGHPVVGDATYGHQQELLGISLKGQLLHAKTLVLTQPTTGEKMTFDSPLPSSFERVLKALKEEQKL
ncbi:RluA family pseudouridine synthase [Fructobacillus fructosus]|uniref:Pseudouridine synthase n=1 Tax=Fructobacillus fructosus TaxID=1631 RepID=A0ABM9MSL1_9LACO|nr:23S rRNA- or tRNA-specific (RluA) [Fructobacillus fructosus]CAK1225858.1 23S rRNA- or tRNA-specific (RluA) [Fructobacillus fructosus]CAK1226069.1 23S rRNA- or tRNA-specific (RluA) [Fructobacillus fructosus]CAK1237172.1 23S rRNA- or tRNA-specific (RluA) [Fructobacillus fructosus]